MNLGDSLLLEGKWYSAIKDLVMVAQVCFRPWCLMGSSSSCPFDSGGIFISVVIPGGTTSDKKMTGGKVRANRISLLGHKTADVSGQSEPQTSA